MNTIKHISRIKLHRINPSIRTVSTSADKGPLYSASNPAGYTSAEAGDKTAPEPDTVVGKAMLNPNDSRTFPRLAVLVGAAAFYGFMTYNTAEARGHHLETDAKNDPVAAQATQGQSAATSRMKDALPKVMDADKYKAIEEGRGLGVENKK